MKVPSSLKSKLVDIMPTSLLFHAFSMAKQRSNKQIAQHVSEILPFPWLEALDINANKKSHRVFILGSGASINLMSAAVWEDIYASDSIGFNFWLVHNFVPSLYVCEAMDPRVQHLYDISPIQVFLEVASERAEAYAGIPKLLGDVTIAKAETLNS